MSATDPAHRGVHFSSTTSTGVLRRHLYENHIGLWLKGCADQGIDITAQEAQPAIQAYHNAPEASQLEVMRPPYSKEAFFDALVEFIVADDQV
jgi:hypothetical protein